MKTSLLHDVLSEGDYRVFRENLAAKVADEARRKRNRRRRFGLALAAAIAAVAGGLLSLQFRARTPEVPPAASAPWPHQMPRITLQSKVFPQSRQLVTKKALGIDLETRSGENLAFETNQKAPLGLISDAELMALFPDRPRGFVAEHGQRRFVLADPADAKLYMSSN